MAAVAPVMIGTAMAFGDGIHDFPTASLCLLGALLIQVGTNIANDYYDFKHGADTAERLGPTRVTQSGLIKPEHVRAAFILIFGLAAAVALQLFFRGGWPIAAIGVASIISGILYTARPKPLGYMGLGDLFVLVFFGPVAVAGTYYVQSYEINPAVIVAGLAPGLMSVAILAVNNYRDIDSDRKTGKKTLAVRFGREFAQVEYATAILLGSLIPVLIYLKIEDHLPILWSALVSLLAIPSMRVVFSSTDGRELNNVLAATGRLLFIYAVIFSIGWIL